LNFPSRAPPQRLISKVETAGAFIIFHTTTRPVPTLSFELVKVQKSKLNKSGANLYIMYGKSLVNSGCLGLLLQNINE